ncbi:recombinase RecT [Paenibacillus sp. GYB004]|uniref:RecT family recombinase n=1 Tax=Paenibacillus sp. GYB004 TaxID=2994393 RepID=UPI002F969D0B
MANNTQIVFSGFEQQQVDTIRHTLAKDATPEQFNLFMSTAVAAGLNPMLNHIYCIVYGGKLSIQISVEGIMFLAKRVEGYAGIDVQLVYDGDEFRAKRIRGDDGKYFWDVEHEMGPQDGKVIGCYAFAYRDGFPAVYEYMKAAEVQHHLTGNNAGNWKKYFNDFFKKTVVKRAAKRQYGIEIAEDDAPVADSPPAPYERRDITDEVNGSTQNQTPPPEQPSQDVEAAKMKDARQQMKMKFQQLGITDPDGMDAYINKNAKFKGVKPTLAEMTGLLKIMDMDLAAKQQADDDILGDPI